MTSPTDPPRASRRDGGVEVARLGPRDVDLARRTFLAMAEAFEEDDAEQIADEGAVALLTRDDLWVYAAVDGDEPVGGLTAFVLPLTRRDASELFVYDIAVTQPHRRRGIGRALIDRLLADGDAAGIAEMWVPASDEDVDALDFYRRIGGEAEPVTIFTFPTRGVG